MSSNKDLGFGRCACGSFAICILSGVAKCLDCFGVGLRDIREIVEGAARGEGRG